MKFIEQHTLLKKELKVLIRKAEITDAKALLQLIKEYLDDSEYIPINTEDFKQTELDILEWIKSLIYSDNSIMLVAEFNGKLIGNLDITGHHRETLMHTAILGMGILKKWRGVGLGKAMLSTALQWARTNDSLEIITLDVYVQNIAALALYRKFGFYEIGIIPNFIKDNGRYYDNVSMWTSVK